MLLEDIDKAFVSPSNDPLSKHPAYDGMTRVSYSGLLDALDGVASADERILFMTTNHIDALDEALIRPGRVDIQQYFGQCTVAMMQRMFQRFYYDVSSPIDDQLSIEFGRLIEERISTSSDKRPSPAQIQGHLLVHKHSAQAAVDNVDCLWPRLK